jgi:hypothetical protein
VNQKIWENIDFFDLGIDGNQPIFRRKSVLCRAELFSNGKERALKALGKQMPWKIFG